MKKNKDMSTVWIRNSHGVVSAKPKWMAEYLLKGHPEWEYCDPEPGPKEKAFPLRGGQYTEQGRVRRKAANVSDEPVEKEYTYKQLKEVAKSKGTKIFGKKATALAEELGLKLKQ